MLAEGLASSSPPPGESALARYACDPLQSRGRRIPEPGAPTRNEFQRDRDRIVHSSAFRRLVYKTQVFLNHEGDLFRTRLTHTLEVAQLARSMARHLRLHEDLVEAIALAHDLGHTPFGHAGQDALNHCMQPYGGFEHNLQSLRVVDKLEKRYPAWDGLNLCLETRAGILKRCPLPVAERMSLEEPDGPAARFLCRHQPSLEAQLTNLADEIAYHAHDIDDGMRSGLLSLGALREVPLFERFYLDTEAEHPGLGEREPRRLLAEIIRRMLSAQVYDVLEATTQALEQARPMNAQAAREGAPLVCFSAGMQSASAELKRFLFRRLYRHPQVTGTTELGKRIIADLFAIYVAAPAELPVEFQSTADLPRSVADYIAGMTDRFASREHRRLTAQQLLPVD